MPCFPSRRVTAAALAVGLAAGVPSLLQGQASPVPAAAAIHGLAEPEESLIVQARSPLTGLVTFASTAGQGLLLPGMAAAPAEERALTFVDQYGKFFGLATRADVRPLKAPRPDALGLEHVRLRQVADGIPVTAGELLVHLRGDRVVAVNGRLLPGPLPAPIPELTPAAAQEAARALVEKHKTDLAAGAHYGEPRLEVFNRGMIDEGTYPTRLAWFVEATGDALREYIWVDATTGGILLNFSQLATARNRTVYDANFQPVIPGTLVRSEGQGPTAILDVNQAYDFAGATYDYFFDTHGRDSYDGAGAELRATVRYREDPAVPYANAFWNGQRMVYGEGYTAADDVVAHELTHAVTQSSAEFFYYYQSGALDESYADIFAQAVDLSRGTGDDPGVLRWRLAEDLPIGALRDMMTPTAFGDPGKMSDPQFYCASSGWTNPANDRGGVHHNSGIPNHAFALMVDGGSYNGRDISGIGLQKAALIQYRALTTYLTSGSTFADNAMAVNQSCTDLIGTSGITAGDCAQVANAILAVEMASPWACPGATAPPATFCPSGGVPAPAFSDAFETGGGQWSTSTTSSTNWVLATGFAKSGTRAAWGMTTGPISDHQLSMALPTLVPAGGRMYFDHAFEFEHAGASNSDGGVLEYSTNDGSTWVDAGSLIDAGQAYGGVLDADNILGARSAFVRSSYGYTGTRLNLASLASQLVRFRFRVGTDNAIGSLGWFVDNVSIYACVTPDPPVSENDAYSTPFQTALNVAAPGVLANDTSNGVPMTAVLNAGPSSGTLVLNANGSFTYTPNMGFAGADSFTYHAVNEGGAGTVATVALTVVPPPPVSVNDTFSTPFQNALNVAAPGVLANDISNGGGSMTAALDTGPASGTLVLDTDGSFTYTPNTGFLGVDSFTYRASNANGVSNAATVSITVFGLPTAVNDEYWTPLQTALNVPAPGVLANDTSNGGGPMTAVLDTGPSGGTLVFNSNGGFTYTPNTGFSGTDSFTYRASNANGMSNAATVSIAVNALPTAVNDAYSTPFQTALNVAAPGVLGNDTSAGGAPTTAILGTGPSSGMLVFNANGGFTYTPNPGFAGVDSFTYRASNPNGLSNAATVSITVNGLPTTVDDAYSTPFQTALNVAAPGVLANDTSNGGPMTAVLNAGPSGGTLVLNANGGFTYTPNAGFSGADSFTYHAVNDGGAGNVATVAITVAVPPVGVNDAYATPFQTPLNVAAPGVLNNDTSNGGGPMTAVLNTGPSSGTLVLNANGSFSYMPNTDFSGADSFTYRASNANGVSNAATVSITVNGLPTAVNDAYSTPFETPLSVSAPGVLSNDISNGGGPMTAVLEIGPSSGTLVLDANGSFAYTPNAGFTGNDAFSYRASNPNGPGNIATVSVSVEAAPTALPPTDLYVSSVVGNLVTVRWTPPASGLPPTGYKLEGGLSPGQVLASIPIPGTVPIFTFTAPSGSFFIRVHTISAASTSEPSNEVPLVVNLPVAPSAPAGLTGFVNGSSLTLAWRNTFGGGAPSAHLLDVSGSINTTLPLGPGNTFSFAGVPPGTYTVSLRAANAGGASAPSNPVTLTFPGPCSGAPLTPDRFIAYKVGNRIVATWDPAASGSAPTSFVLSVTGSFVGALPTAGRSLSGAVGPGIYNLAVTAVNPCGSSSATGVQTVTIP